MMKDNNMSLSEIENMLPWEREVYINLIIKRNQEENEQARQAKNRSAR